jgi:5-methylcytosine-specific restriction endonuclease McrA
MKIITMQNAAAAGLKRHFTGDPCKNGHIDERLVSSNACISCNMESVKKYRAANAETIKELRRKHHAENPDIQKKYRAVNPIKTKETKAKYYAANRERECNASRDRHAANPEIAKKNSAAWERANPESRRIRVENRRARRLKNGGVLSKGLLKKLFAQQKGMCPCCGQSLGKNYHMDHIIPLALGGSNTDDNMQLLTATCNLQKSVKHPIDFMQSRGFLL